MGSGTGTVLNGPELGPLKNNALDCAVLMISPFSSNRLARIRPPDANTASVGFHEAEVLAHWFLGRHSGAARRKSPASQGAGLKWGQSFLASDLMPPALSGTRALRPSCGEPVPSPARCRDSAGQARI